MYSTDAKHRQRYRQLCRQLQCSLVQHLAKLGSLSNTCTAALNLGPHLSCAAMFCFCCLPQKPTLCPLVSA